MKSSLLAVFFLGAAIAACSSTTPNTGSGGEGGDGGEEPTTSSNSSSSSGMGGAGGNGGGGGAGGGAPAVKADKLGQVCNGMTPCPMGYTCVLLDAMATNGFCTLPCGGQMDMTTCSAANGFPGPGQGRCALGAQDMQGNITTVCAILCGAQLMLPEMCPTGLTCQDKINAMGMPGMDGKTDLCVP